MKDLVCEYELVGRYRITGKFIGEGSFSQARTLARSVAASLRAAAPDRRYRSAGVPCGKHGPPWRAGARARWRLAGRSSCLTRACPARWP